jgi:Chalcone isomerase-like
MLRRRILAAILLGLVIGAVAVGAGASDSSIDPRFATTITSRVGGKDVRLVLTGTAMRTKYMFNVYAVGSYVQEGVKVRDAEGLVRSAAAKQLHLIFERDVEGETMAQSFREAIGMNHRAPAFEPELAKLEQYFRANPVKRGDQIRLTSIPGVGLGCQLIRKPGLVIEDVKFAEAAWEAYLGRKNLGVAIQSGLTSRL